jgi:hypothetical protein
MIHSWFVKEEMTKFILTLGGGKRQFLNSGRLNPGKDRVNFIL